MNAITGTEQPPWSSSDLLDPHAPNIVQPQRTSDDKRPISAHGRRLLSALTASAILYNGLTDLDFDSSFTRLPTRDQDCPGVLDYIFGPPSMHRFFKRRALEVVDTPADFSDHQLVSIRLSWEETAPERHEENSNLFKLERLLSLKMPEDDQQWAELNQELQERDDFKSMCADLQDCTTHSPQMYRHRTSWTGRSRA